MSKILRNTLITVLFALMLLCSAFAFYTPVASKVSADITGFTLVNGAYVRVPTETKKDGIRFETRLTTAKYQELRNDVSSRSGVLLIPTNALGGGTEITVNTTDVMDVDTSNKWTYKEDPVTSEKYYYAAVCLTDVGAKYYDMKFSAVGYIYTDTNGYEYTTYTDENNSRNMSGVAMTAIEKNNLKEQTDEVYKETSLLYNYVTKAYIEQGNVYATGSDIVALPTFDMAKPEYTVTNANGNVTTLNGNKLKLETAGVYTATLGDNTVKFSVTDKAKADTIITTANFDGAIGDYFVGQNGNVLTYDAEKGAYKHVGAAGADWTINGIGIDKNSEAYAKLTSNVGKYTYVAMDVMFSAASPSVVFQLGCAANGSADLVTTFYDEIKGVEQSTKRTFTNLSTVKGGEWYTLYFPVTKIGTTSDFNTNYYKLFGFNGATAGAETMWFKNFRYTNTQDTSVSTNIDRDTSFKVGTTADVYDEVLGIPYVVTAPSGSKVTPTANTFTFSEVGNYTATNGADTFEIPVLSNEDYKAYIKVIAPLNAADSANGLYAENTNYVDFAFDSTKGAYKVTPVVHVSDNSNAIVVNENSTTANRIKEGCELYDYVAFDLSFSVDRSAGSNMIYWFAFNNGALTYQGDWFGEVTHTETFDNEQITTGNQKANVWYTVYVQAGGLQTSNGAGAYRLFSQQQNGSGLNTEYYVKNIRFEDSIPAKIDKSNVVANNGVYPISELKYYAPESIGANPVITGGDIAIDQNGGFVLSALGNYTLTGSLGSISFRVVDTAEYVKNVAELTSANSTDAFYTSNAGASTFAYDDTMGAYKFNPANNTGSCIIVDKNSEEYTKILLGCDIYTYLAMDIYFTDVTNTSPMFWMANEKNTLTYQLAAHGEVSWTQQVNNQKVDNSNRVVGVWYTVYIQTGGLQTANGNGYSFIDQQSLVSDSCSAFYLKNIRFTNEIPA